jgi:hypothetical protein
MYGLNAAELDRHITGNWEGDWDYPHDYELERMCQAGADQDAYFAWQAQLLQEWNAGPACPHCDGQCVKCWGTGKDLSNPRMFELWNQLE